MKKQKQLRTLVPVAVACFVLVGATRQAVALPSFGANCTNSGCHAQVDASVDLLQVDVSQMLMDIDDVTLGTPRGSLRTFMATPGETVALSMDVLGGSGDYDVYMVRLRGLGDGGVLNSRDNFLSFQPDQNWDVGGGGYILSDNGDGISWPVSNEPKAYNLQLDPSTPLDVYDLEFAVITSGGREYDSEHFYLNVVPEPGTLVLWAAGLAGIALYVRRRRK